MRIIRIMLVLLAALAAGAAVAAVTRTKLDDDVITGVAVAVTLVMMRIAARTEKQAMAQEEQARKLQQDKYKMARTLDWFSNGTTTPLPVLRAVPPRRR